MTAGDMSPAAQRRVLRNYSMLHALQAAAAATQRSKETRATEASGQHIRLRQVYPAAAATVAQLAADRLAARVCIELSTCDAASPKHHATDQIKHIRCQYMYM